MKKQTILKMKSEIMREIFDDFGLNYTQMNNYNIVLGEDYCELDCEIMDIEEFVRHMVEIFYENAFNSDGEDIADFIESRYDEIIDDIKRVDYYIEENGVVSTIFKYEK